MKELHNHIFSNTTCISKETMLRYINHQLSTKELHEVEKHMLDCDLCSDAIEGMKYAQNSSVLFAIDNQIDQRVRQGKAKTPVMKNLMVAASILIIVFGAYFTFDYFTDTANEAIGIALNNEETKEDTEVLKDDDKTGKMAEQSPQENQQEQITTSSLSSSIVTEEDAEIDGKYRASFEQAPPVPMVEDAEEEVMDDFVAYNRVDAGEEVANELKKEVGVTGSVAKDEKEKLNDRRKNEASGGATIPNNTKVTSQSSTNSNDGNVGLAGDFDDSKNLETAKVEAKKSNEKRAESPNKGKKDRYKAKSSAPAFSQQDNITVADKLEEKIVTNTRNPGQTITLSNLKVVDYTDEYQKEYELNQVVETKSVTADFETLAEAEEAEREIDETTIEITYRATLEKAMAYYNAKKYALALEQFDIILKEHPEEVNGLFYGGLSNYHLQRYTVAKGELDKVLKNPKTSFNEEAEWYKALTLIELNQKTDAKTLLQKIAAGSGFYKTKAQEKLQAF